jgi:thiol-disulfide isomerase/thioredoxin
MFAISRRTALGGLAGLVAQPVLADSEPPVAHGILANNPLALAFTSAPEELLPDVKLQGPTGAHSTTELKGRTLLIPLWAEWCAPCFAELPDFARLQRKYGNDKFQIIPILSGTQKKFTVQSLAGILVAAQAGVFAPLMEDDYGDKLVSKMARQHGQITVPCNLLIAPDGRVVGREIGRIPNAGDAAPAKTRDEVLKRTEAGDVQSLWGQQPGEEFAAAMANGFLG